MILILIFILLFVIILAGLAFWLAAKKIMWLERRCDDLWQERGKMMKRIKELEKGESV